MGRSKNYQSDTLGYILMLVIGVPIFLIAGVVKFIAFIYNLIKSNQQKMEAKKSEEEKEKRIKQFCEETEIKNEIKNISKLNNFNYMQYYDNLMDKSKYKEYIQNEKPTLDLIKHENKCIKENILLEKIYKKRKYKRLKQEKECEEIFNERVLEFEKQEKVNKQNYEREKKEFENDLNLKNNDIICRREKFLNGDEEEIRNVLGEYLKSELKKNSLNSDYSVDYSSRDRMCIINFMYKDLDSIPKYETQLNFFNDLQEVMLSEKERLERYEEYIHRCTLKIINIVFSFHEEYIKSIVFNGYVNSLNPAIGCNEDFTILSVEIAREEFSKINLEKVTPKLCLNALNYRFTENLLNLKPVMPFRTSNDNKSSNISLKNIDSDVDGYEFENISKDLLIANGFTNVQVTRSSGDFGADVIAYKNEIKYAIQCKKYSQPVGVKAIQEVMGSKSMYGCHVAVVLTNNIFTPQARKLAEKNNVLLWDRTKLQELIAKYELQIKG